MMKVSVVKKWSVLALAAWVVLCVFSFSKGGETRKQSQKKYCPPGTIWLKDSLYLDEVEITNYSYLEYVSWAKEKYGKTDPELVKRVLPDTLVRRMPLSYSEPLVDFYFRHPAYHDYPVIGVSHEQASAYCSWRTERVREYIQANRGKLKWPAENVYYRLPTAAEWEYAAAGALDTSKFFFGHEQLKTKKGMPLIISLESKEYLTRQGEGLSPQPTSYGEPNALGFYNLIGNVAEMVSEKGVSKGGGWPHALEQSKLSTSIPYQGPEGWLGFRCICEIAEGLPGTP